MATYVVWSLAVILTLGAAVNVQQTSSCPYTLSGVSQTATGLTGSLTYQGTPPSSAVVTNLFLNVTFVSNDIVRVQITDANNARYQVPISLEPFPGPIGTPNFVVQTTGNPFSLNVTRINDGKLMLFLDPKQTFQYNDQDIIVMNNLGYNVYFYGLGERTSSFHLAPGQYTTFAFDSAGPYDSGHGGANLYGHHPFYLALDPSDGTAFGGFLLNSNDQDAFITSTSLQFRTIGGIIDLFVFDGPTSLDVVQQYQSLLGTSVLIPYWGLGWHQCRYGYHDLATLQAVVQNYTNYVIPLDVMWTDIDYMLSYWDFTLDTSRYPQPEFSQWIEELHSINKHFIPIIDAGVAQQNYVGYNQLVAMGCYIKYPGTSAPFVGSVWPGNACFVDWFHPNATQYWWNMLDTLKQNVDFDGVWLDMNEASNMNCNGECGQSPVMNNFPYSPGNKNPNTKAIDMGAGHYNGYIEYNTHSLYGFMEAKASSSYFSQHLNQRPFIIGRSSFPTHGRYASKWLGDNFSGWDWYGYSIAGVFDMEMFGIPVIGADICGFNNDATEELCSRWTQMGTLYPFSRNHNSINTISQEPWALGPQYLENSILAIRNRYSLLNYFYTLMFRTSWATGGMIWQPAFFQYPNDSNLYDTHSTDNFLIGDALIVHPCLQQGVTQISAYFPNDVWYDWYFGARLVVPPTQIVTLQTPAVGLINIHIKGGRIVPRLDSSSKVNNVIDLRESNTTLVIAPDATGNAIGAVVYDDGANVNTLAAGLYSYIYYHYTQVSPTLSTFTVTQQKKGYTRQANEFPFISMLQVYNCTGLPLSATMNNSPLIILAGYDAVHSTCSLFLDDQLPVDETATIKITF